MKAHRGLVLYKRHNSTCVVNRSKIPLAKRRFWMDCDCQIWIVGRMPTGEVVPRQPTGCTDIKKAEAVRAAHIAHFAKATKADAVHGPTIAECAEKYLASRRHELGDKTIGQHKLVLDRLMKFCEANNAFYMRDLSVDLLETFKTDGFPDEMAGTSKATAVAKLRCFLRSAYRRDWIKESLVDKVTSYRRSTNRKNPTRMRK